MSNRRTFMFMALVVLAWIGSAATGVACASGLDPSILSRIDTATFEVVAAKPTPTGVTYEKPLPMDLLPYQQRSGPAKLNSPISG